jgi:putative Mn2+ efflux pump MntP
LEKEFPTFLLKLFNIYANPEEADTNNNKVLSAGEAALLAAALSLDGLATGFGAGLAAESALLIILFSLFTDAFLLTAGRFAGSKVARKIKINLSWLSGLLLIGLAFLKLFI